MKGYAFGKGIIRSIIIYCIDYLFVLDQLSSKSELTVHCTVAKMQKQKFS